MSNVTPIINRTICVECGMPFWSYIHAPEHPANRGNEAITHAFVKPELYVPVYA